MGGLDASGTLAVAVTAQNIAVYTKVAQQNNPAVRQAVQQRLAHWRSDPDLAAVRDMAALDRLPEGERDTGQTLWRDVDELRRPH